MIILSHGLTGLEKNIRYILSKQTTLHVQPLYSYMTLWRKKKNNPQVFFYVLSSLSKNTSLHGLIMSQSM